MKYDKERNRYFFEPGECPGYGSIAADSPMVAHGVEAFCAERRQQEAEDAAAAPQREAARAAARAAEAADHAETCRQIAAALAEDPSAFGNTRGPRAWGHRGY